MQVDVDGKNERISDLGKMQQQNNGSSELYHTTNNNSFTNDDPRQKNQREEPSQSSCLIETRSARLDIAKAKRASMLICGLLHAKCCNVIGQTCPVQGCHDMKLLLRHIDECHAVTSGTAACLTNFKGCVEARRLLAHYDNCCTIEAQELSSNSRKTFCLLCSFVARHEATQSLANQNTESKCTITKSIEGCTSPSSATGVEGAISSGLTTTAPSVVNTAIVTTAQVLPNTALPDESICRDRPTCSHYGPFRKIMYPGYFFCSNCSSWDDQCCHLSKHAKRTSKAFKCRANHTSWIFPTDRLQMDRVTKLTTSHGGDNAESGSNSNTPHGQEKETFNEDEKDVMLHNRQQNNNTHVDNSNNMSSDTDMQCDEEDSIGCLCERISELKEQLNAANQRTHYWKTKYDNTTQDMENGKCVKVESSLDIILRTIETQYTLLTAPLSKRLLMSLATVFVSSTDDDNMTALSWKSMLRGYVIDEARQWYRSNVFSPENILKAMDMTGGQLSLKGVEILRKIEVDDVRYCRKSILPSSAEIKRVAAVVEAYAKQVTPYEHRHLESGGECIEWDVEKMIKAILLAFGLYVLATQCPVSLNQAIDGAQLTDTVTHMTCGMKVADIRAKCPFQKSLIFGNPDVTALQSRNLCFITKMILKRESKEVYPEFKPTFDVTKSLGGDDALLLGERVKLKIATNCDLNAVWKALGVGGATKRDNMPCHCCPIESKNLVRHNDEPCLRYCQQLHSDKENWKCYHHDFFTDEMLNRLSTELEEVANMISTLIPEMDLLVTQSKMHSDEDPREPDPSGDSLSDINSIHFDYNDSRVTRKQLNSYSDAVTLDLLLRQHPAAHIQDLDERRQKLQDSMVLEWTYRQLKKAVDHGNKGKEGALFVLINAVPCILHMENRVGLKTITMLLSEGLCNALTGTILSDVGNTANKRMKVFFQDVEKIANTSIWGSVESPTQWQCPRDENKKAVGTIQLDNNRTRTMVNELDLLIDFCIADESRKAIWLRCICEYRASMELVRKKTDFTDDEIVTFQHHVDCYFQDWVTLHGLAGVTNYIHMLSSGHVSEYLFYWRNLYVHSQQGWEAFNSLLKTFYFRRTGHGGGGHKGPSAKSKIIPIARWMSRRVIWMLGTKYSDIKANTKEEHSKYDGEFVHE